MSYTVSGFGKQGEELALEYLKQKDYDVVVQNFYTRFGEIDLVVWDKNKKELVFVEVKTRGTQDYGRPEEAIDKHKLARMERVANIFLNKVGYHNFYRFDCVAIELGGNGDYKIKHFKNLNNY